MQKQSLTTSRLMPSQSLSNSNFGKTPLHFIAEDDIIWNGIALLSVRVKLSQPCPLLSLLTAGAVGNREDLTLCKHCSAIAKILVRY